MSAQARLKAELILAVDAGGTKTAACLARPTTSIGFEILGRGRSGGANPLSIGIEQAVDSILAAVNTARCAAGMTEAIADRAVLSVAGAADAAVANELLKHLRPAQLAQRAAIVSDVAPILAMALDGGTGIALIAGTGSVAIGEHEGRQIRCGGWGYLLGDDGSGYSIGRAALRTALEDLESGLDSARPVTQAIVDAMRVGSLTELTKAIYNRANPRLVIASFAEIVAACADAGDFTARQILDDAARDLATLVLRTARHLSLEAIEVPLAIGGGVLAGSQHLRDALQHELRSRQLNCRIRLVTDPLAGCLELALREHGDSGKLRWN